MFSGVDIVISGTNNVFQVRRRRFIFSRGVWLTSVAFLILNQFVLSKWYNGFFFFWASDSWVRVCNQYLRYYLSSHDYPKCALLYFKARAANGVKVLETIQLSFYSEKCMPTSWKFIFFAFSWHHDFSFTKNGMMFSWPYSARFFYTTCSSACFFQIVEVSMWSLANFRHASSGFLCWVLP